MSKKSSLSRKLMILLPAAMLLGMLYTPSTGCGDPCVNLCEDAKGCNMLANVGFVDDMGNPVSDCTSYCEDTRTANEEIGCGNEFDDFMSCFSSFDVCQDFENQEPSDKDIEKAQECSEKTQVLLTCVQTNLAP